MEYKKKSAFRFNTIFINFITSIQGIYNYIPGVTNVCRVQSVTSVLWLKYLFHLMLFSTINVSYFDISTS